MQHTAHVPKKNMLQSTGKVLMASQRNLKAAKEQERKEAYIKSVKNQHYKTKVDWLLGRADPVRQSQVFTEESVKEDSAISEYTSRSWWVIDPRVHASIAYWDVFTAVALLFTAIFGPVEVAFVQQKPFPERLGYPLFLANRAVDLIFISDMALQFVVGYSIELDAGLSWVLNGKLIAYHYIRSRWFYIDLFSVLASIFDLMPDTEGTSSLVTLRAVRVLRLFKLVRLARGSRIFQRYEKKFSINYAYLSLVNTGFTILFCCHFFACIWGLQASFNIHNSWLAAKEYCFLWPGEEGSVTQEVLNSYTSASDYIRLECPPGRQCDLGSCNDAGCSGGSSCPWHYEMYFYALYWSVMTITSVGYGDVAASPHNIGEQITASVLMLMGGLLWTALIGVFCGICASINPSTQQFHQQLTTLNSFMSYAGLPHDLRYRLREYVFQSVHVNRAEKHREVLQNLSPAMQGEVSWLVHKSWIGNVWFLRDSDTLLKIELATQVNALVFPPFEQCPPGFMYVLLRGTAICHGKVYGRGRIWGDDIILHDAGLRLQVSACAVTYLWVYTIDGDALLRVLQAFPHAIAHLDHLRNMWTLRRAMVRFAELISFRVQHKYFFDRIHPLYALRETGDGEQEWWEPPAALLSYLEPKAGAGGPGGNGGDSIRPNPMMGLNEKSGRVARRRSTQHAAAMYGASVLMRRAREENNARQTIGIGRGPSTSAVRRNMAASTEVLQLQEQMATLSSQMGEVMKMLSSKNGDAHKLGVMEA